MYTGTIGVSEVEYYAETVTIGNGDVFVINPTINERAARLHFRAYSDEGSSRSFEAIGHMVPDEGWIFIGTGEGVTLSSPGAITLTIDGGGDTETWHAWVGVELTQNYAID